MEIKKYPNAALENYSKILIQLGLVLSLFIVYQFINMKSYPQSIKELTGSFVTEDDTEKIIEIKTIEPIEQQAAKALIPDKILKVDDKLDVEETLIENTETDETDAVIVSIDKKITAVYEEEEIVEDVPFLVIENVPIFPGCKGNNDELRACFSAEVTKFVTYKFDSDLASDLGLTAGSIQKIFVLFKIDKNGNITDIRARAPHKQLQDEATRVINLLPKMIPGKQRGKPVGVQYGLPIVFKVQ